MIGMATLAFTVKSPLLSDLSVHHQPAFNLPMTVGNSDSSKLITCRGATYFQGLSWRTPVAVTGKKNREDVEGKSIGKRLTEWLQVRRVEDWKEE
ncbi:hypothetical protein HPP92_012290 [Vanilla planifolia]|uniref:Uncharacterized protein n=1 Tax=Vanilla planifolia TaxID=51239 RepID=A0A835QUW1_VANPL|nr:hypothetical protein HPP92_012290 [Vanilla planifolia]